jgi:uncharacterized protein (TIGR02246 family)
MQFSIAVLAVMVLASPGVARGQAGVAADDAAVQKLVQEWDAARNQGDWKAFAQFYTADATTLSSDGTWRKGQAEIEKGAAQLWNTTYKGSSYRSTVESVRTVTPDVLVADTTFEISGIPGGGSRKGRSTLVLTKSDGGWKIAAVRSMVPVAAGAVRTSG